MGDTKTTLTWMLKDEVSGPAKKIGQNLDTAGQKGKGFGSIIKGVGAGIGIGAFNLFTSSIGGLVNVLGDASQAYKDDQVSQTNLANSLKNNIPNWDANVRGVEAYAAAQGKLGFTDDEVRASIGQLVGVTHDLSQAQQLNSLAQDLARAKGIDLATATDIVTKAHEGNGKALKALGIDTQGATDAVSLLDAIQQNVKGSAEEWAKTSEGKTAVSQVKVGEAMEKIGKIVDKVAQVVLPMLADAFVWVAGVVEKIWPYISKVIGIAGTVIGGVIGGIVKVVGAVVTAFRVASMIISGIWNGISSAVKGAINIVIGAINAVIRGINSIHFTTPDWLPGDPITIGFHLATIPKLHRGGVVPGAPGSEQLALLQAGETVIPRDRGGEGFFIRGVTERELVEMVDRGLYFKLQRAAPTLGRT